MRPGLARRAAATTAFIAAVAVAAFPAPSSAEGPQATGWWSRRLPLQAGAEAASSGGGGVTGLSTAAVAFTPGGPAQLPPLPGGGEGGTAPPTTIPLPVPIPTVPELPVPVPDDPGPGTPNPTVPEGGLWVANDPTGAVAISALRFRGDIGAGELTLRFAPGSTTVGPLVACPALSEFEPTEGGAWRDRPAHGCDRMALTGRRTSDGTGVTFSIPQGFLEFGERVLDVVVLPEPTRGDPFSVIFEPPGADSLEVTEPQVVPEPGPELPEPDPASLPEPAIDAPVFDAPSAAVDVPAADLPLVGSNGGVDGPVADPAPVAALVEPLTESRAARIIAVAVLLALGAGLWSFGGQPVRHPRLLGALGGATPALVDQPTSAGRGIGRFRRERTGRPTRL
jgi:hypothetical protein